MKKKHIDKKKMSRECWSLDYSFIMWLNSHIKKYYEDASKHIDMTYNKFYYNDKEYTLEDICKLLIKDSDILMYEYFDFNLEQDEIERIKNEMLDLFKLGFSVLWW